MSKAILVEFVPEIDWGVGSKLTGKPMMFPCSGHGNPALNPRGPMDARIYNWS